MMLLACPQAFGALHELGWNNVSNQYRIAGAFLEPKGSCLCVSFHPKRVQGCSCYDLAFAQMHASVALFALRFAPRACVSR